MKARVIELLLVVAMSATILGSYYVYERIKAHNQMDEALLNLVRGQAAKPEIK